MHRGSQSPQTGGVFGIPHRERSSASHRSSCEDLSCWLGLLHDIGAFSVQKRLALFEYRGKCHGIMPKMEPTWSDCSRLLPMWLTSSGTTMSPWHHDKKTAYAGKRRCLSQAILYILRIVSLCGLTDSRKSAGPDKGYKCRRYIGRSPVPVFMPELVDAFYAGQRKGILVA